MVTAKKKYTRLTGDTSTKLAEKGLCLKGLLFSLGFQATFTSVYIRTGKGSYDTITNWH